MSTLLPSSRDYLLTRNALTKDVVAGFTVAIVALPLALGFGITSGMSAAAGLTTAIIAGFLAALFGGSRFQVSGPTGAHYRCGDNSNYSDVLELLTLKSKIGNK